MGVAEINVAYDGTFGDLGVLGADATMFNVNDNFDFNSFLADSDMAATDGFTAINGSNAATISPKDVFNNDSVPPSTAFTNLTTPGSTFIETPDDDYQTSPLFGDNIADSHGNDNWFSLFPDADNSTIASATPAMARTTSTSSGHQIMVHPGGELNRKRSPTANASPAMYSPAVKHSSVAGVNARKRDKPLPPIVVNEGDSVALKRARNTAAARKSRAKKVAERDELESEIADLKAQVEHWKALALGQATLANSQD
ncbi:Hypothetical protein R9X50_00230800 [Acrodontium crateriforme]|uniref:BZIP domain-containing protein n=1 Tax=Acrodontium crateriforme TaxID=150365 RepID=A0AAQ3M0R6_9PEZI|nr:Hypothetical protein R9X50_00230800 [Acrodontium crateriforme]